MSSITASAPPAGTVALVDGRPLLAAHVERRLELIRQEAGTSNLPAEGSPEAERLRRWVVHTLVDEALVETEARILGFPQRADPALPLTDEVVVAVFDEVTASVTVEDEIVADHYRRNLDRYRRPEGRHVVQVIVDDAAAARELRDAATRGDLERAAATAATAGSGARHVEVLEVRRGQVGAALERAVFDADPDEVVGPIRTRLGWHVLQVTAVVERRFDPLDTVTADIRADLLAAARGRGFDTWLADRRRRRVTVTRGNEHPGDPRVPDSIHRH